MSEYDLPNGYDTGNNNQYLDDYLQNDQLSSPSVNHTESSINDYLSGEFLFTNVGAPFIIGLAVGYFAKKTLKFALFLGGAAVVLLFITEYYGITQVNDAHLKTVADSATQMAKDSGGYLVERLSQITGKGVSAVVGFFTGLKFG
jgi:uncharacterized membrane protein (Fun14 family)